jgi:hypothetical protein
MVRLITHNLLACHAKNCTTNNFPLVFQDVSDVVVREADFNAEFVRGFLPKIEWAALVGAARQVRVCIDWDGFIPLINSHSHSSTTYRSPKNNRKCSTMIFSRNCITFCSRYADGQLGRVEIAA